MSPGEINGPLALILFLLTIPRIPEVILPLPFPIVIAVLGFVVIVDVLRPVALGALVVVGCVFGPVHKKGPREAALGVL